MTTDWLLEMRVPVPEERIKKLAEENRKDRRVYGSIDLFI